MYIYTPHVCSALRGQSTCWSPWSWDYDGCELPCGCWELIWVLCKNNTCSHHRATPTHHFKKYLPLLLLLIFPISAFISSLLDRVLSQLALNSLCSQRMALNFGSFCLHLLSAEIMGIYHHTSIQFIQHWGLNPGLHTYQANTLHTQLHNQHKYFS